MSTKPEDLTCKSLTPPIAVALISAKRAEPETADRRHLIRSPEQPAPLPFGGKSSASGPLEPLNLNSQHELPAWPRPYYPPHHYLPLNTQHYHPYAVPSYGGYYGAVPPSPPHHAYPAQPKPMYVNGTPYTGGLSPTSPTSSTSSTSSHIYAMPPATPEDLSSPGSVGSSNCGGFSPPRNKRKESSASPRYQCTFCSKSYSTYSGLSKHQQFHCQANEDSTSAKKTFSCKDCDKVYVSLGALKMHIRTHTLPCKCKLCGKAFSRPWLLQGHIRTHTGEKPFTCQHCNRAFADRSNLRAHLQTHSDVKKYSCPTCAKTFSRMSLLTKHAEGGCPGSQSPMSPSPSSASDDGSSSSLGYHHLHHQQPPELIYPSA